MHRDKIEGAKIGLGADYWNDMMKQDETRRKFNTEMSAAYCKMSRDKLSTIAMTRILKRFTTNA